MNVNPKTLGDLMNDIAKAQGVPVSCIHVSEAWFQPCRDHIGRPCHQLRARYSLVWPDGERITPLPDHPPELTA